MIPEGTTHTSDFYGQTIFYKKTLVPHLIQLIDHPEEQWQMLVKWFVFERDSWVDVGSGFSDRRLKPI